MPTLVTRPTRRPPNRRRTVRLALAIIGSLLLHALVILAVVWIVPHWPRARPRIRSQPIQMTMLPPTTATPEPSGPANAGQPTPPPYIRTLDDQLADKPPDDPSFISDKDTKAASLLAANGNKPMPTTEGKEVPFFDFEPRPYRLGDKAADAATSAASAQADQPPAPVNTPPPTPPPVNKKPPLPPKSRPTHKPAAQPTPAAGDLAQPKAAASSSPEPAVPTPMDTPRDDENVPPPVARSGRQPQSAATANSNVTSNGAPKPPGYQQQSLATKMSGNINNRGRSAVSALGTPLGRYQKAVNDAIGMLWYYQTEQHASDLGPGTVKIHFYVDRDGRIKNVHFTAGNANSSLGLISEQAITEAQIEPIPPEVAAMLDAGQLESEISFSFYSY